MGTAIGDILIKEKISLRDLSNKKLGFDAYNIIYQFLSSIRDIYGEPLKNDKGEITSHIVGIFYRISNILEHNIKAVFVFDGEPLSVKSKTIKERNKAREIAKEKFIEAMESGLLKEARKYAMQSTKINEKIVKESIELLEAFGIPCIKAKHDGEAQIAMMNKKGILDGCVSQDYDVLLFGGKKLYRNITISGKKRISNHYKKIEPELIDLQKNLKALGITHDQLIDIAILVGTDFNNKVPRIGAKTALKLIKKHSIEEIFEKYNYKADYDLESIRNIFKKAEYKEVELHFKEIDFERIEKILIDKYSFSEERVKKQLEKLKKEKRQKSLLSYL